MYNATKHQQEILDNIFETFKGCNRILLKGCAGTGKTFLINLLTQRYLTYLAEIKNYGNILLTAPTNKAVSVLQEKSTINNYSVKFQTIHKVLSIKRVINEKTGEISFKRSVGRKDPLERCRFLIIDESSMLDSNLLDYILELNIKVLFVGDYRQLNPVDEKESPVFKLDIPTFELVEIIRQGENNPIIDLSYNLSKLSLGIDNYIEEKGYYFSSDFEHILKLALENPLKNRVLAWTNIAVNSFNKIARERLYGENPNKIEVGEYLILSEPYENMWTNFELKVEKLSMTNKKLYITRDWIVDINCYVINKDILAVHESSEKEFNKTLREIKKKCNEGVLSWKVYLATFETFIRFSYMYAITVHKSQGSTYDTAILNYKNMCYNPNKAERKRLLYTAITRASNTVVIYQPYLSQI